MDDGILMKLAEEAERRDGMLFVERRPSGWYVSFGNVTDHVVNPSSPTFKEAAMIAMRKSLSI